jgi:hypothetical protein
MKKTPAPPSLPRRAAHRRPANRPGQQAGRQGQDMPGRQACGGGRTPGAAVPPQATTRQARRLFAVPHHIASPGTRLPTAGPSPPWTRTPGYARSAPPGLAVSGRVPSASGAAQHRSGPAQTPPASKPLDVSPSQASCRRSRA